MFRKSTFPLTILLFLNCSSNGIPAVDDGNNRDNVIFENRDNAIQELYNCTCIPFFECEGANLYMVQVRNNFLNEKIVCPTHDKVCCKNVTADVVVPESVTMVPELTTADRRVLPKNVNPRKVSRPESCGIPTTFLNVRILNPETDSQTSIDGEMPWMVEIFEKRSNGSYRFKCTGSLIHPRVVLTVQHYLRSVTENSLKIIANSNAAFENIGVQPENERNVLKIIKHPEYYSGGLHNDIALIILDKEYDVINTQIRPICLPDVNESFDGTKCIVTGWGENDNHLSVPLKKVDVPVVDFQKCQDLLRKTRLGSKFKLHPSFLCAGGEAGKDTCHGDGGSPLFCVGNDYRYVQIGIVSWGVDCGVVNQPGLYANVSKFKNWIKDELQKNKIELDD